MVRTSFTIERGGRRQGVSPEITESGEAAVNGGGEVVVGGGNEGMVVVTAAPMAVDGDSETVTELYLQGSSFALPNISAIETGHRC